MDTDADSVQEQLDELQAIRDPIRFGGLMRCCLTTLGMLSRRAAPGEIQPCNWCRSSMVFREGAWEWNRATADAPRKSPSG